MTEDELQRIKNRRSNSQIGHNTWSVTDAGFVYDASRDVCLINPRSFNRYNNTQFIKYAQKDIDALLEYIEELKEENHDLRNQ